MITCTDNIQYLINGYVQDVWYLNRSKIHEGEKINYTLDEIRKAVNKDGVVDILDISLVAIKYNIAKGQQ